MYPVLCIDVDEHAKQSLIDRRGQRAAARHVTIFLFPRNLLSLPISFSLFRPRPRYLFRALSHACGMACVLFCSPIVALTRSDGLVYASVTVHLPPVAPCGGLCSLLLFLLHALCCFSQEWQQVAAHKARSHQSIIHPQVFLCPGFKLQARVLFCKWFCFVFRFCVPLQPVYVPR